jgi:hypothetical protein
MVSNDYQNRLRYFINRFIFDNGYAPTTNQLASLSDTTSREVEQGLQALADNHALVLHPNSFEIWVAHPFALFPTLFWVKAADKHWWGNCTWCSFGIAALTKTDTQIFTKLEGEEEPLTINIKGNKVIEEDYVVHFPIPANKFWDNVIYTCANILTFKGENDIEAWCKRHNKPKGHVMPIGKLWTLSRLWYGNYLDPDFRRKTKDIAQSMFEQVGLTSEFWKL